MPRSLRGRMLLAFTAVGLAAVVAAGAALFIVLRDLHREATFATLRSMGTAVVAQSAVRLNRTNAAEALTTIRDELADPELAVLFVAANGTVVTIDGAVRPDESLPSQRDADRGDAASGLVRFDDGREWATVAVAIDRAAALRSRALVLAKPDRAAADAARDLARTLPVVLLAVLLVGAPLAWLLARSTTGPLRRLTAATASIPSGAATPDLPAEGPAEVRELTEHFRLMAGELAEARRAEDEMLANLRHDLRTPLTVIGGFAEALADGTADGPAATHAATAIRDETARLERLVDELGAIESLRAGGRGLHPERIQPRPLLDDAAARFAPRAQSAAVDVAVEVDPGAPAILADRLALERIVSNLLENALRALTARAEPEPGSVRGRVVLAARPVDLAAGPGLAISVADDGPGLPPGAQDRVFERSWRGDPARSGPGTGLGLAIVRELAAAHGGTAVAENLAPHGARISVLLPTVPPGP
ncbi:MAG: two-component sensor histidine kinase [Chloroflexi bacterium]|nr:two-component sensor histidine kinase [Chloroflexota bacterium]